MQSSDAGFSLPEAMISLIIMLTITSIVATGLIKITQAHGTIWNRTEMHSSVRSATELLQQEVGQAGLITLPAPVTLQTVVAAPGTATVTLSSVAGMFVGEQLTFDAGINQETAAITAIDTANRQVTAAFTDTHVVNAPVSVLGGFANGIVPTTVANGSTASTLKLFGDINGDGNMVYVEYWCDYMSGNLYRNVMPYDTKPEKKLKVTNSHILLSNIIANPEDPVTKLIKPCFEYQKFPITVNKTLFTFVLDVAVTLTVEAQDLDPIVKKEKQRETKALLNVSPRNVFNTWAYAGMGYTDRIQSTPASVVALLPLVP